MIRKANNWIRKTNSFPGVTLGKRLMVEATNQTGYEVQEFRPGEGWMPAIEEQVGYADNDTPIYVPLVVATKGLAEQMMEALKVTPGQIQREMRVYPALTFPVKK